MKVAIKLTTQMVVYKFLDPSRIDVLENLLIRFTPYGALNDPLEAIPSSEVLEEFLEFVLKSNPSDIHLLMVKNILNDLKSRATTSMEDRKRLIGAVPKLGAELVRYFLQDDYGVLSLSRSWSNFLMWSHYAASHSGYVIGFDASHDFFTKSSWLHSKGLEEVIYSNVPPEVPIITGAAHELRSAVNKTWPFTKHKRWIQEDEVRLIADLDRTSKIIKHSDHQIPYHDFDIHLFEFPKEAVREIIVGYNAHPGFFKKLDALNENNFTKARFYKAFPTDDGSELDRVLVY